jgi:hypothetical protein
MSDLKHKSHSLRVLRKIFRSDKCREIKAEMYLGLHVKWVLRRPIRVKTVIAPQVP